MELPYIYYGLIFLNAIVFLSGKKSKLISIPSAIFLILFVMGKRFNDSFIAYDLRNYEIRYGEVKDFNTLEVGYKFLNYVGNSIGLSFDQFYMLLVAIIMITIFIAVKKIGGNIHLFLVSWYLYFVLISMDQLRNQSALSLMMLTMLPFFTTKERSLRHEFIMLAVVSLFHFSFILYAIPLYLSYKYKKAFALKWFATSMVFFLVLTATSSTSMMESILSMLSTSSEEAGKYERYVGTHTSLSSIGSLCIYLLSLATVFIVSKKNKLLTGIENKYQSENLNRFFIFMLFSSCLLFFLIVNATFYRIPRDLSFISIAYLGINTTLKKSTMSYRMLILSSTLVISAGWFLFDIIAKDYLLDYYFFFFDNAIFK